MPYPTTGSKTELQAINQILASVGQAPVTTLERTNPDVAISYDTLLEVSMIQKLNQVLVLVQDTGSSLIKGFTGEQA